MVDGVGNNPQQNQTLKLKGKDGKSINLENLKGLQKTKGNEALFKMYDKDNDGVISDKEAAVMQKNLYSLSNGNGKISQREMKALFGDNSKSAFEALSKLADQQATAKGEKYTEVNGNTTTSFYNSNFGIEGSQREDVTKNSDGSTVTTYQDGTVLVKNADGSQNFIKNDGTIIQYDKAGKQTGTIAPDGTEITFPDNDTAVWTKDGKTIKTVQSSNGKEITKEFGADGNVTSITVAGRGKDGDNTYTSEMKFTSEADMQNNRPSSEVRNRGLATETHIVYKYDSNGNVQADAVNLAGESTRTYKNANGEEIKPEEFNAPKEESYSYTVPNGHSITKIVTDNLKQQGIENPTKEQIKEAAKQLVDANANQVHTMKEGKYKGNQYFLSGAEIKMPKFKFGGDTQTLDATQSTNTSDGAIEGIELAEVTITANKLPENVAKVGREFRQQYGDQYDINYTDDGQIKILNKNGEEVPNLTQMANAKANPDKLAAEILQTGDQNENQSLDKSEFRDFIISQLGTNISGANRIKLDNLIESSFASLDSVQQDGTISREELEKKSFDILNQISSAVDEMENNQFQNTHNETVDDPNEPKRDFNYPGIDPYEGTNFA